MKQKHRINPGYEGGEYTDRNVIILSPTQHAMWHFAEWQRKNNWQDYVAWRALAGLISKEEVLTTVFSEAGKIGAAWNKDPANKHLKLHRKGKRHSQDARRKMREAHLHRSSNPGDQLKAVSPEQRARNAKKGLLARWGYGGIYPEINEFRTALSETFVDYFIVHGHPNPKRVRSNSSASSRLAQQRRS